MKKIKFSENVARIDTSGIRKIFEAAGSDAINLGLGQPDFDTPDHIKAAAIKAINEGFTGYTVGPGIPELREALSSKFKEENGFSVSPEEIIVTSGASEALTIALAALLNHVFSGQSSLRRSDLSLTPEHPGNKNRYCQRNVIYWHLPYRASASRNSSWSPPCFRTQPE